MKSQVVMEEALRVLGWVIADEVKKRTPPSRRFVVLGVVVALTQSQEGVVVVRNKEDRVTELGATINEMESLALVAKNANGDPISRVTEESPPH